MRKSLVTMILATTAINHIPFAFEPGKSGWKVSADGKTIEMKDGNPVWVDADGKESVLQQDTITRLNGEAAGHRKDKETAEKALKAFEGLDAKAARTAIETLAKVDQKRLIDAGEVDKVKAEISQQFTAQIQEKDKALGETTTKLNNLRIDNVFNSSQFVRDQIALPNDIFQAYFRSSFKVNEKGEVEAYGKDGNRVFSKTRIGEMAAPDEALAILVDQHPQKDVILKPSGHSGSGNGGGGGNRGGSRKVTRAELAQMTPSDQASTALKASKGEVSLVD